MKKRLTSLLSVFATSMVLAATANADAVTSDLQLKRLDTAQRRTASDQMFWATYPQSFFMQSGVQRATSRSGEDRPEFSEVVKKEPAEYVCDYPFRGVAKLGSQDFAFVLDSAPDEKEQDSDGKDNGEQGNEDEEVSDAKKDNRALIASKLQHYNRLYFDLNHNGDLTDDKVIEAEQSPRQGIVSATINRGFARYSFPRVDVTIDADGVEVSYAFFFSIYSQSASQYQYASASLSAAAYREGEITVDGETRRIVLVDYNSNGRFDDEAAIDESVKLSSGAVYPKMGDMVYVDPDPSKAGTRYGYDVTTSDEQHYVAKLLNIDGQYYNVAITPAGDKLTLTPSNAKLGYVTNPNQGYRAVVYGDNGFMKVSGDESGKSPLPEGKWKLLSYTIDRTAPVGPAADAQPDAAKSSLLQTILGALGGNRALSSSGPKFTYVSAGAKRDYPAVEVRDGETVELPFGPPFKPLVESSGRAGANTHYLSMSLVGCGGEVCRALMVDGKRPPDPEFTITDPDGEEILSDSFEYG